MGIHAFTLFHPICRHYGAIRWRATSRTKRKIGKETNISFGIGATYFDGTDLKNVHKTLKYKI
jgi:hypothetical protein